MSKYRAHFLNVIRIVIAHITSSSVISYIANFCRTCRLPPSIMISEVLLHWKPLRVARAPKLKQNKAESCRLLNVCILVSEQSRQVIICISFIRTRQSDPPMCYVCLLQYPNTCCCGDYVVAGSGGAPGGGPCVGGSCDVPGCCNAGSSSSQCRSTAALAGVSCASAMVIPGAYGDSYSMPCPAPAASASGKSSGSDLVDLPRLLFPDEELDWLALFGPVGVNIDEMGIRVTGGALVLGSSAGV